jgi:agmatine deiminase
MKRSVRPARLAIAVLLLAVTGCVAVRAGEVAAPAAAGYTFPPEWAPHEAVWMGWSDEARHHKVQVEMIRAMAPHVKIRLMVTSDSVKALAAEALAAAGVDRERVEFITHKLVNFWIRDPGPLFLSDGRRLAIAEFGWNVYGYPLDLIIGGFDHLRRGVISKDLAEGLNLPVTSTPVVAEGGMLEVSDEVILTYKGTALQRNPGVRLEEIEREYLRVYGKRKVVWLGRPPLADRVFSGSKIKNYFGEGANGHIDEYVRFINNSTILIAQIDEQEADWDPLSRADDEILRENLAQLRAAVNVDGRPFDIITLPVPALRYFQRARPLREEEKRRDFLGARFRDFAVGDEINWVPAVSYLNFFVTNGVVLVPAYWREGLPEREREKDEMARATLQRLFPGRRVVQINPLEVNWSGGGMHCITQQQPRVE